MKKQQKAILMLAMTAVFITTAAFLPTLVRAGDLEPSIPPELSMHTMDEIYKKVNLQGYPHAPVAKTGQTASHAAGDDGYLQKGMACPYPRFTDHLNGTVTDNLTGLMWTKNANIYGLRNWSDALLDCSSCTAGGHSDWRLPHVGDLHSLIDYGHNNPALPAGHPFANVQQLSDYWSSSTFANYTVYTWCVNFNHGWVGEGTKNNTQSVWCVRGGQ